MKSRKMTQPRRTQPQLMIATRYWNHGGKYHRPQAADQRHMINNDNVVMMTTLPKGSLSDCYTYTVRSFII